MNKIPQANMTLNEYQLTALKTAGNFGDDLYKGLACTALGLTGEGGEVADYIKKVVSHGHAFDAETLTKELGDVLWYISHMGALIGVSLEDIAMHNLTKLQARYPNGFDPERSINREED